MVRLLMLGCLLGPFPAFALRLASTSPQVTELLYQLGKGSDLVAASAYSRYPEAAAKLPTLGGFFLPSVERAVSFRVEALAFDHLNANSLFSTAAGALGIKRFDFDLDSIAALERDSRAFLKNAYGEPAPRWVERLETCAGAYRPSRPFRFLALTWFAPPIAFGSRTFLSDLLTRLGGRNVVPESWRTPFPQLALDWVAAREIDYVFLLSEFPDSIPQAKAALSRWWKSPPPLVSLDADHFARATRTALEHADDLDITAPKTAWRSCLDGR